MAETASPVRGYDAATKWPPFAEWHGQSIERQGWSARPLVGHCQILVSGRIDLAREALCPAAPEVGLWGIGQDAQTFVRVALDRALIVSREAIACKPGWDARGWAATAADDSWLIFELAGDGLRAVCAEAITADLETGSPSAALSFAGIPCLLYRVEPAKARLHVERPFAPYIWRWLETRAER